jgi:hypothetical protein
LPGCRSGLKGGDPDLTTDELVAVIEKAEAKRAELMASATREDKRMGKVLHALPAAARSTASKLLRGCRATRPRPHWGAPPIGQHH